MINEDRLKAFNSEYDILCKKYGMQYDVDDNWELNISVDDLNEDSDYNEWLAKEWVNDGK